jgi:hypothetical protein
MQFVLKYGKNKLAIQYLSILDKTEIKQIKEFQDRIWLLKGIDTLVLVSFYLKNNQKG